MAGWSASQAIQPLVYDLRPYAQSYGTIREPTEAEVTKFLTAIAEAAKSVQGDLGRRPEDDDLTAMIDAAHDGMLDQINEALLNATLELCGGQPSREDLELLPHRPRQGFYGWLMGELAPKA